MKTYKSLPAFGPIKMLVDVIWIDRSGHAQHINNLELEPDEDLQGRVELVAGSPFDSILRWRYAGESTWYGWSDDGKCEQPGEGFSWYCPDCGEMYQEKGHAYCSGPHADDPSLNDSDTHAFWARQESAAIRASNGL